MNTNDKELIETIERIIKENNNVSVVREIDENGDVHFFKNPDLEMVTVKTGTPLEKKLRKLKIQLNAAYWTFVLILVLVGFFGWYFSVSCQFVDSEKYRVVCQLPR